MGTWNKLEKIRCAVEGCNDLIKYSTGYCNKHHLRFKRYRRTDLVVNRGSGYTIHPKGYIYLYIDGRQVAEHVYIAEQALGKRLPKGAQVHHVNGNPMDNNQTNLVVCPNRTYHALLHKRAKELGYENN